MIYRIATPADIPALAALRKRQLADEGAAPQQNIDPALRSFFERKLADRSLTEWVCVDGGEIIATAAILFVELPPTYANPSGQKGYITNMYTDPAYRGRGIAIFLLKKLTEEARARGVESLWLHASAMGRPVYLRFGFTEASELLSLDCAAQKPSDPSSFRALSLPCRP